VIGTGVAGSVFCEALHGAPGITVEAFDRLDTEVESGTGLNVGPNALKALRLHLPARHAAVRAVSLPWRRWFIDLADGTRLFDLDLLDVAEEPGIRLRWAALYRTLRAPIADITRQGLELEALEEDAAGRLVPVLRGAGGLVRPGAYDLLVAGDGRFSALRALTAGPAKPVYFGMALTRLLVQDASGCPYDDYGQWFNGHARLLSYRLPDGAAYIAGAVLLPDAESEVPAEYKTAAYQRALYTPRDRLPCPAMAWMIDKLELHVAEIHWARLQEAPLQRVAAGGRVLFLGDAAQAMVPTLGQGATQAIEDGVIAGGILRRGGSVADVSAARDARVEFVRRFSVEASDTMFPGTDPVEGSIAKGGVEFLSRLRRLYTDVP
jgi:salicylate hydroxylase